MLKVCLIGVGGISRSHIAAWEKMEDAVLTGLCDVRPEQLAKYPEKHHYSDLDAMLDTEKPDILDICLPTYLHADYAVRAMEKGVHVLCEKPISLKAEDVDRVYAVAEANNVCFMVAQVLRFWPEYEFLKNAIDSGCYGKLLSGNMSRLGNCPGWSWDGWMRDENRSGLVSYDLHIHDLDFLVYALGAPKAMQCHRSRRPEQDYVHAVYEYDGCFVATEASWYAGCMPFHATFRFQFERAVVVHDGGLTVYHADGTVQKPGQAEGGDTGTIQLPKTNAYANEIRYFTDCVKAGQPAHKVKAQELSTVIDILNRFPR